MKKFIILLVALSAIVSSCVCPTQKAPRYTKTEVVPTAQKPSANAGIITARIIRVGRYTEQGIKGSGAPITGTVLIFENGQVFKELDYKGSFACALQVGDKVTYKQTSDGKITLQSFVYSHY